MRSFSLSTSSTFSPHTQIIPPSFLPLPPPPPNPTQIPGTEPGWDTKEIQNHACEHGLRNSEGNITFFKLLILFWVKIVPHMEQSPYTWVDVEPEWQANIAINCSCWYPEQKRCSRRLSIFLTHIWVSHFSRWPDSVHGSGGLQCSVRQTASSTQRVSQRPCLLTNTFLFNYFSFCIEASFF